ncbi:interleukin-17 receptor C [Thalassophryne amazonica]|uniref:interleukin-17 receptor C n=1 Tax=Thalassophryne amazonica TaxID=390379 RepID=UPI0014714039|nr:interleukin-17 receptor C [Thalassophryne amazonica]
MFLARWSTVCVLLTLNTAVFGLKMIGYNRQVICSQGLSDCTMKDEMPLNVPLDNVMHVRNLMAQAALCCKGRGPCALCLLVDIRLSTDMDNKGSTGHDDEDYSEDNPKGAVTVCYNTAVTLPTCKKVEFTVNHSAALERQAQISMVILNPVGVSFSSQVFVHTSKSSHLQIIAVPSLDTVCSLETLERVEECDAPRLNSLINHDMNQVELQVAAKNKSLLSSMCLQYEQNGKCQRWTNLTIPLNLVTPCVCLQVWWDEEYQRSRRSLICPFLNTDIFQRNVWKNVTVFVVPGQMSNYGTILSWNLSAPCRLEAEVWPCHRTPWHFSNCKEMKGFRQHLPNATWRQNSKGRWEKPGVFENIDLQLSPCVMVKIKGMENEMGPFCFDDTGRHHWSLLIVAVMLVVSLTACLTYLLRNLVKRWASSCHNSRVVNFSKFSRTGHVVLLSPPDADGDVSGSVCALGSLLSKHGFGVSVDQWSRKEQCSMGPLLWLHSQLLKLDSSWGRVVLVVTHRALKRTEEWSHQHRAGEVWSPYSDVFTACLFLIRAHKHFGKTAAARFLLVTFERQPPGGDRGLPELLQGLPLFQLPFQTQALLSELTAGGQGMSSSRRTWTWWRAKEKDKDKPAMQKLAAPKCLQEETKTLKPLML